MTGQLKQAFAFSAEELTANQQGLLTTRQKRMVAEQIRRARTSSWLAMLAVFGSLLIFVGLAFFREQGPIPPQAIPFLAGTAVALLSIVGVFTFIGFRRLRTLQREKISVAEGRVQLTTKSFRHGRWTGYYATIDDLRFQLPTKRQFEALTDGHRYRIYFLYYLPTHLILSVEEIR